MKHGIKLLFHTFMLANLANRMESPSYQHDVKFGCFLTSTSDIFTSLSLRTELFSFTFRPSFLPSSSLRNCRHKIQDENIDPHILLGRHVFTTNNHQIFKCQNKVDTFLGASNFFLRSSEQRS